MRTSIIAKIKEGKKSFEDMVVIPIHHRLGMSNQSGVEVIPSCLDPKAMRNRKYKKKILSGKTKGLWKTIKERSRPFMVEQRS
jgi:hypothetical protein